MPMRWMKCSCMHLVYKLSGAGMYCKALTRFDARGYIFEGAACCQLYLCRCWAAQCASLALPCIIPGQAAPLGCSPARA